jgi:hypothetical protein
MPTVTTWPAFGHNVHGGAQRIGHAGHLDHERRARRAAANAMVTFGRPNATEDPVLLASMDRSERDSFQYRRISRDGRGQRLSHSATGVPEGLRTERRLGRNISRWVESLIDSQINLICALLETASPGMLWRRSRGRRSVSRMQCWPRAPFRSGRPGEEASAEPSGRPAWPMQSGAPCRGRVAGDPGHQPAAGGDRPAVTSWRSAGCPAGLPASPRHRAVPRGRRPAREGRGGRAAQ